MPQKTIFPIKINQRADAPSDEVTNGVYDAVAKLLMVIDKVHGDDALGGLQ